MKATIQLCQAVVGRHGARSLELPGMNSITTFMCMPHASVPANSRRQTSAPRVCELRAHEGGFNQKIPCSFKRRCAHSCSLPPCRQNARCSQHTVLLIPRLCQSNSTRFMRAECSTSISTCACVWHLCTQRYFYDDSRVRVQQEVTYLYRTLRFVAQKKSRGVYYGENFPNARSARDPRREITIMMYCDIISSKFLWRVGRGIDIRILNEIPVYNDTFYRSFQPKYELNVFELLQFLTLT